MEALKRVQDSSELSAADVLTLSPLMAILGHSGSQNCPVLSLGACV